jgi:hypothetical protein
MVGLLLAAVLPLVAEAAVDELRATAGLEPLGHCLAEMDAVCSGD